MHDTLDSHYLWQSPWYNLRQDRLRCRQDWTNLTDWSNLKR